MDGFFKSHLKMGIKYFEHVESAREIQNLSLQANLSIIKVHLRYYLFWEETTLITHSINKHNLWKFLPVFSSDAGCCTLST